MRDIYDTKILLTKVTDDLEQVRDLFLCQCCGRLIKNDNLSFMGNCFCDLTHLLFSDCQVFHLFFRIDLNVQILKKLFGILDHLFVINAETLLRLTSDEDVLSNSKITYHVQLLMYDYNAGILCLTCIVEFCFLSFVNDGT